MAPLAQLAPQPEKTGQGGLRGNMENLEGKGGFDHKIHLVSLYRKILQIYLYQNLGLV